MFGSGVPTRRRLRRDGRRRPATTGAELLGLAAGDAVVHGKWGEGKVVETGGSGEDAEAVVVFASVGRKKLLLADGADQAGLNREGNGQGLLVPRSE